MQKGLVIVLLLTVVSTGSGRDVSFDGLWFRQVPALGSVMYMLVTTQNELTAVIFVTETKNLSSLLVGKIDGHSLYFVGQHIPLTSYKYVETNDCIVYYYSASDGTQEHITYERVRKEMLEDLYSEYFSK